MRQTVSATAEEVAAQYGMGSCVGPGARLVSADTAVAQVVIKRAADLEVERDRDIAATGNPADLIDGAGPASSRPDRAHTSSR